MSSVIDVLKKRYVGPLFGLPKEKNVDIPQSTPSEMWLVKLGRSNNLLNLGGRTGGSVLGTESLRIQTVPMEMEIDPAPNWAVIPSLGRNNPFYHYTGGEDTLQMTLDWYSVDPIRNDVIEKCRWVQSLCKADGYNNEPPAILLIFGELFRNTTWIIKSAPYKLSLFDKEMSMMPRQAYQELTLAKVTDHNTTVSDIRTAN